MFEKAGLEVVHQKSQRLGKETSKASHLCEVAMWVLKPVSRGWDQYLSGTKFYS